MQYRHRPAGLTDRNPKEDPLIVDAWSGCGWEGAQVARNVSGTTVAAITGGRCARSKPYAPIVLELQVPLSFTPVFGNAVNITLIEMYNFNSNLSTVE